MKQEFITISSSSLLFLAFFNSLARIQAIDGGFFEKFGSLLRQRSETAEDLLANSHELQAPTDNLVNDSVTLRTIEEHENDSGTETLHDTDSEPEDQHSKQEELIKECTGLNVSKTRRVHKLRPIILARK